MNKTNNQKWYSSGHTQQVQLLMLAFKNKFVDYLAIAKDLNMLITQQSKPWSAILNYVVDKKCLHICDVDWKQYNFWRKIRSIVNLAHCLSCRIKRFSSVHCYLKGKDICIVITILYVTSLVTQGMRNLHKSSDAHHWDHCHYQITWHCRDVYPSHPS